MNASTINTNTITLRDSSNHPVAATVSYNASSFTAVLTPSGPLAPLTNYTAVVKGNTDGVTDVAGNPRASDFTCKDFRELMARPDIDAVQITTPDHWHPLIALEAARQGKHMYQEKPMGWSFRAAHAVQKAVHESGVVFQFGTQQRSDGKFRFACELVRNGKIGQLKTILVGVPGSVSSCPIQPVEPVPKELDYDLWLGPAPMAPYCYQRCRPYTQKDGWSVWYSISDYCMGMIGNWGVHHLDIAQWGNNTELSGPTEIEGTGVFPKGMLTDCAVSWQVENRYANGVTLVHMDDATSKKHPLQVGGHGHGVMFLGTEGWVHVDRQATGRPSRLVARDQDRAQRTASLQERQSWRQFHRRGQGPEQAGGPDRHRRSNGHPLQPPTHRRQVAAEAALGPGEGAVPQGRRGQCPAGSAHARSLEAIASGRRVRL